MSADRPVTPEVVTDAMVRACVRAWAKVCAAETHLSPELFETAESFAGVRAGLEAVVPLIRERLAAGLVAVDPADLWLVLDQDTAHYHQRPGVWDDDNPPERAGSPCAECAARERLLLAAASGPMRGPVDGTPRETAASVPPTGWCRWHQMVDCHGDAPECRQARAEIEGRSA